jgi:hypothetical protein
LDIFNTLGALCWYQLSDDLDWLEKSESEKRIKGWRQSERKVMIETIQDLIQTSHKYSKSQYTPSGQRARWIKLAGQLIWYKDQILKNTSLEAMEIEMAKLKERVLENEEWRKRQSLSRNRPMIVLGKPGDDKENAEKAEHGQTLQAANASDSEGGKETVSQSV